MKEMVATTDENNIKGLLSGWGLSRTCDNCRTASALLYCRADAAFLCGPCDAHIHQPRTGTPAHERVWVCEVCDQVPAVVHCKADAAWLCSTCDHDIHSANPLSQRHDRVPITPFVDSPIDSRSNPSSAASSAFLVPDELDAVPNPPSFISDDSDGWLIPNPNNTFLYNESELLNFSYGCDNSNCQNIEKPPQFQQQYETKPIVDHSTYNFTDSVVPTQSHNSNNHHFSHHSESNSLFQNCFNIDFSQPNKLHKKTHNNNSSNNSSSLFSTSSFNYSAQNSVSSSDIGVVPDNANSGNSMSEVSYSFARSTAGNEGGSTVMDREAKVLRYREKRKNRKFQKTIRYASRKAYAETRPRIKGRFAKRTEAGETLSDLDFAVDNGYGVVPAFC